MGRSHSFSDYIKNKFSDNVESALKEYYSKLNADDEDSDLSDYRFESFDFKSIEARWVINILLPFNINVEVLYSAELHGTRSKFEDTITLHCTGTVSRDFSDFSIVNIVENEKKDESQVWLSDSLIPIISKETRDKFDVIAKRILKTYWKEKLEKAAPVDPRKLAERMHLNICFQDFLSPDKSIFGMTVFADSKIQTYLYDGSSSSVIDVPERTILIDKESADGIRPLIFTIAHEIVHWQLHRNAFEFERLYNQTLTSVSCFKDGEISLSFGVRECRIMEWQANQVAGRIIAPKHAVTAAVKTVGRTLIPGDSNINKAKTIVDYICMTFNLSKQAGVIRLGECGYDFAKGLYHYIDNHYLDDYFVRKGTLGDEETYELSFKQYINVLENEPFIRDGVVLGMMAYVDGHICRCPSKYTYTDEDGMHLTLDALEQPENCFVKFKISAKSDIDLFSSEYNLYGIFRIRGIEQGQQLVYIKTGDENKALADITSDIDELLACFRESTAGDVLKSLMKACNITIEELCHRTGISKDTISDYRNGNTKDVDIKSLIAICLGMKLPIIVSMKLLSEFGRPIPEKSPEYSVYIAMLSSPASKTVSGWNEFLVTRKLQPLTKIQDDYWDSK